MLGKNISYSLSPKIHSILFNYANINASYEIINVEKSQVFGVVKREEFQGFNVTIPYKKMFSNINLSDLAKNSGAVNTIMKIDNKIYGYNTDIYGFIKSLDCANISLQYIKTATILGTGGVANAIAYTLLKNGISYKFVSRNKQANNIISYSDILYDSADILINASPIGMPPFQNELVLCGNGLDNYRCYMDTAYSLKTTPLQEYAKNNNKPCASGLKMLVAQAIASQNIWFDNIHSGKELNLINYIILKVKNND